MPSSLSPTSTTSSSQRKPKSSRQQFSACGACRMRRVRCDLKDHYDNAVAAGIPPSCSNCRERGLKCVDEYADIKTVKLLRRGRRLQQVEAVYGHPSSSSADPKSPSSPTATLFPSPTLPSVIPTLSPAFFRSDFFRRFHVQRPIVDPEEYVVRYTEYYEGNEGALEPHGRLIAMILAAWAVSYGVNEHGQEHPHNGYRSILAQKSRCNDMIKEILQFIDLHGILRKPTWDGARALLLLMSLTEEVQSPLDRLVMLELAISQVYTLCNFEPMSFSPGQTEYGNALAKARIFWYTYVIEGITTSLRGGRLHLSHDDLEAFQDTLPPFGGSGGVSQSASRFNTAYRLAAIPIQLSSACRQVHTCLTGAKAKRRKDIDEIQLQAVWKEFDRCWNEFERFRSTETSAEMEIEDREHFVSGWQIFIFECYNVTRESLKQRIIEANSPPEANDSVLSSGVSNSLYVEKLERLHAMAESKCIDMIKLIMAYIRRHRGSTFFEYDASLTRDGVFFASFLLAEGHGTEQDLEECIAALKEFRWAFSKSEEREHTLKMVLTSRTTSSDYRVQTHSHGSTSHSPVSSNGSLPRHDHQASSGIGMPVYDDRRPSGLPMMPLIVPATTGLRSSDVTALDSPMSAENMQVDSSYIGDSSQRRRSPREYSSSSTRMPPERSSSLSIVTNFPPASNATYLEKVDGHHRFNASAPHTANSDPLSSTMAEGDASHPYYSPVSTDARHEEDGRRRAPSSESSSSFPIYSQYGGSSYYLH